MKSIYDVILEMVLPRDFTPLSLLSRNSQVSSKSGDLSCVMKSSVDNEILNRDCTRGCTGELAHRC